MGVASHRVWAAGGGPLPLGLYAAQLVLNLAWTPLFFKAHNLKAATVDITGGTLGAVTVRFVAPVCAWCAVAGWLGVSAGALWAGEHSALL